MKNFLIIIGFVCAAVHSQYYVGENYVRTPASYLQLPYPTLPLGYSGVYYPQNYKLNAAAVAGLQNPAALSVPSYSGLQSPAALSVPAYIGLQNPATLDAPALGRLQNVLSVGGLQPITDTQLKAAKGQLIPATKRQPRQWECEDGCGGCVSFPCACCSFSGGWFFGP